MYVYGSLLTNVCYHMRIPAANEETWLHLLPKCRALPKNISDSVILDNDRVRTDCKTKFADRTTPVVRKAAPLGGILWQDGGSE